MLIGCYHHSSPRYPETALPRTPLEPYRQQWRPPLHWALTASYREAVTRLFLPAMQGHYCAKAETSKAGNPLWGKLPSAASSCRPLRCHMCSPYICELLLALEKQGGPSCCKANNLAWCMQYIASMPAAIMRFTQCFNFQPITMPQGVNIGPQPICPAG